MIRLTNLTDEEIKAIGRRIGERAGHEKKWRKRRSRVAEQFIRWRGKAK